MVEPLTEMRSSGGGNVMAEGETKSLSSRDMEAEDVSLGVVSKKTGSPLLCCARVLSSPVPGGTLTHC